MHGTRTSNRFRSVTTCKPSLVASRYWWGPRVQARPERSIHNCLGVWSACWIIEQKTPEAPIDLVLDCGRILPGAPGQVAAIAAADHVLVIARPTVDSVASTRWISERLSRGDAEGASASLVLVGDGPVPSLQAASALGLELIATLPNDRIGSAALRGDSVRPGRLARSVLISCARSLVRTLFERSVPVSSGVLAFQLLGEDSP